MGLPVGLMGPPVPPFTKRDFLSAVAIATSLLPTSVHSQGKDRQVQRNQHTTNENRHDNKDQRLDQGHGRPQGSLHIFLVEFRDRVQHGGQGSGGFADFNHFHGQF